MKRVGDAVDETRIDELVARARSGDATAMSLVLERFQPLLMSAVSRLRRRLEGGALDGQDLAQEATKIAIELVQEYRPEAPCGFTTYLKQKLHWRLVNYVRRERRQKRRQLSLDDDPGERLVGEMRSHPGLAVTNPRLRAALRTLSPRQRSVLFKLYWDGCSPNEVAAEMKVTEKNVRALRKRAEEQIRDSLAE